MHQRPAPWSVIRTLASLTLALLALGQTPAAGQPPPPPPPLATSQIQPPQPTGTGRISVRVVAADNGAAVKRARVSLFGMIAPPPPAAGSATATLAIESQVSVISGTASGGIVRDGASAAQADRTVRQDSETDETGTCTFTQLPAAMYSVNVMPQGGFVRTGTPQSVRLGDGGSETLIIRLGRTGAIVGRISDESGDPLMRVQVRALRKERGRLSMTGSSATTDDLGQFRLYDLQPGEYFVSAELMAFMMAPTSSSAKVGFAPTFYPGSAAIDQARAVTVRSAQDTAGIEFSLVRAALGTVTGTALDSEGNPLVSGPGSGANVQLSPRGHSYIMGRGAPIEKDGRFVIRNVPPGDYYLSASSYRGQGPQTLREGAFVPITVNGDDVTMDIRTNKGATVSGRVVFEGEPPASRPGVMLLNGAPAPRVSISARPQFSGPQAPPVSSGPGVPTVRDDDTFELTGLRGSVLLVASAGNAVLKAILRAGEDVTGKPMELNGTEQIEDVVVVLSYDTGSLEGLVVDGKGAPAAAPDRTVVVVYPDDAAHWYEGSPFVRMTSVMTEANLRQMPTRPSSTPSAPGGLPAALTPAQEALRWTPVPGGFFLPRLLPGRYLVVVSDDNTASPFSFDREMLERLKARAASVTVRTGEKSRVEVKMPPATPER